MLSALDENILGDSYSRHFERGMDDDTLVINMGPQHPSTHGVLRIICELDGEYIRRAEPVLGYVHRMHEKMGESKTFWGFLPNMGRVDYLHAMAWGHTYVLAIEKLGGIEVPRRAELLRIIGTEMNRVSSHLLWWGAYLLDLGAFTPIMYAFADREIMMDILQAPTGSRLTYSWHRFGGVNKDFSPSDVEAIKDWLVYQRERLPMYKDLVTDNVILRGRVEGVGIIDQDMCRRYGATGPVSRGSGLDYDCRRAESYSLYDELEFKVPVYSQCDALARYMVRMDEVVQSLDIIEQALNLLDDTTDKHIVAKAPKPTYKPPAGEVYMATEGARGKVGIHVISNGTKTPYRIKLRAPGYSNLSLFAELAQGTILADAVSILGSLDLVIPEIDR